MESGPECRSGIPEILQRIIFADDKDWLMCYGERSAMVGILQSLRPQCAIEIGTACGGSLAVLSQ